MPGGGEMMWGEEESGGCSTCPLMPSDQVCPPSPLLPPCHFSFSFSSSQFPSPSFDQTIHQVLSLLGSAVGHPEAGILSWSVAQSHTLPGEVPGVSQGRWKAGLYYGLPELFSNDIVSLCLRAATFLLEFNGTNGFH